MAYEAARTVGISKKRTDEIIRGAQRILSRDSKTGEFVVRARRAGKSSVNGSHDGGRNIRKSASARRKA